MELETLHTSKLLDMAAQINTMQKGFCDFCTCVFEEIDKIDKSSDEVFRKCSIKEDEEHKKLAMQLAIKLSYTSLSRRYRLKIKDEMKKLTGIELEITEFDTIYDSVLVDGMSNIVEKIITIVRGKRPEA